VLQDQCAWYGISYLIDTTLGLVLAILFLRVLDHYANERDWVHLMHSGVYTGERGLLTWAVQVVAWIVILTIVKIIIYLFMWLASEPLAWMGAILFAPLQFNIRFELVFVMILFPGLLNVVYFWICDGYLKAKKEHTDAHENDETGLEDKKEALMEQQEQEETPDSFNFYRPLPWTEFFNKRSQHQTSDQHVTAASV
jgi:STIMATE family